ncbi:EpsG family protein [Flavihumibacter sp. CACIAM 22H1]|uniref:EpsG family protein n=1 Tax=Flavihumibacter sp. CACIAM 22H1 TaxID=1812911 RepID=UPI0007A8ED5B|nr:EpsG family protein [Flavihumibacter sp. CACIAM 22H1]KYP15123.1 MAG: hypothetical protein A1D16_12505 [Flavihumibacter sp. CACIAM 22H1]
MNQEVVLDKSFAKADNGARYLIIAFLVWPFLGFLLALRNLRGRLNGVIIYLFFLLYGLTFVINPAMDGQRYANNLKAAYNKSVSYDEFLPSLYAENGSVDLLEPGLVFLISRVTSEHYLLFVCFAAIFGFFYLKSIKIAYQQYIESRNFNALVFFLFFPWIIPIFEINGFRFWTASWMFFYSSYMILVYGNKKYLLLALSVCFVHFSFLSLNIVLLLYLLLGDRKNIYFIVSILTLFISELDLQGLRELAASFDGSLSTKANRYLHEDYVEYVTDLNQSAAWFMKLYTPLLFYFVLAHLIFVYIKLRKITVPKSFLSLFCFSLLVLSFSNLSSLIPSGARFRSVFMLFSISMLVYFYSSIYKMPKLNWFVIICAFPFLLKVLISIRVGADTLNTVLFMPGPVIATMYNLPFPVKDWLF